MGIHQLCLDDAIVGQLTAERDRMSIAIHEKVDTIAEHLDRMCCIDVQIRHQHEIDRIMAELATIKVIGDRLAS